MLFKMIAILKFSLVLLLSSNLLQNLKENNQFLEIGEGILTSIRNEKKFIQSTNFVATILQL